VKNRTTEWPARAVLAAMFALAIWAWPSAPEQIPIHWNIAGQITNHGSKVRVLLLMPLVALAGYALLWLIGVLRPEQFEGRAATALSWLRFAYVIVKAGAFGAIVANVRGANIDMNYVTFPILAVLTIAVVNLLVQLNRNNSTKTAQPARGVES
jgi:Protein of unknown function (DUF1648)